MLVAAGALAGVDIAARPTLTRAAAGEGVTDYRTARDCGDAVPGERAR